MKSKIFILAICFQALSFTIFGQIQDTLLNLASMDMPNSPAFILLDKAPSNIERPNSSKAFILSVLNSIQGNNEGIPQNYAVDFTPYRFFKKPNMTADKYYGYDAKNNKQNIFKDVLKGSVSLAFISNSDKSKSESVSNLSSGIRTTLISVWKKNDIQDYQTASNKIEKFWESFQDALYENGIDGELQEKYPDEYDRKFQEFLEKRAVEKDSNSLTLKEILARKPIFAVDLAAGYHHFFLNNNISSNHFGRAGAWVVINYNNRIGKETPSYLNFYAIGRYLSDGTQMENSHYVRTDMLDFGGKIEFEYEKFSAACEYLYRFEDVNTYRCVGILKYRISEQLAITTSFGKNFGAENNLISFLGLNWGLDLGKEQVKTKR